MSNNWIRWPTVPFGMTCPQRPVLLFIRNDWIASLQSPYRGSSMGLLCCKTLQTMMILSGLYLSAWATPPGPVVNLDYVSLIGNATTPAGSSNGPVHFFGGVPYAQPPLGSLRFRAPQPLDESVPKTVPIRDSRNWGAPCIQQPAVVGVGSEGNWLPMSYPFVDVQVWLQIVFSSTCGNLVMLNQETSFQLLSTLMCAHLMILSSIHLSHSILTGWWLLLWSGPTS